MEDDDDLIEITDEQHARIRATIGKRPEFDHLILRDLQLSDSEEHRCESEEESEDDEGGELFYKRNTLRVTTVAQEAAFKRFQALPKAVREAEIQKNLNDLKQYADEKDLAMEKILGKLTTESENQEEEEEEAIVGEGDERENSDGETSEGGEEVDVDDYVDDPDGLSKEEMRDWWTAMNEIWDDMYGDRHEKSMTSLIKNDGSSGEMKTPKTEIGCVGSSKILEHKPCLFDSQKPLIPSLRNKSNQKTSCLFLSQSRSRRENAFQKESEITVVADPRCDLEETGIRRRTVSDSVNSLCSDGASVNSNSIALDDFFSSRPNTPEYPEMPIDKDRNGIIVDQEKETLNSTICVSNTNDGDVGKEEEEEKNLSRSPIKQVPHEMMESRESFQAARPPTPNRQESQNQISIHQIIPEYVQQKVSTHVPSPSTETTRPIIEKHETCRKRVLSPISIPNIASSVKSKRAKSEMTVENTKKLPDRASRSRKDSTKDNIEKPIVIKRGRGRPKKVRRKKCEGHHANLRKVQCNSVHFFCSIYISRKWSHEINKFLQNNTLFLRRLQNFLMYFDQN
ncbi:hypothetical protein CRE_20790 [Caenorhabditis remanei]|uniref:Uncharacterized protein n=1 Tax=Caenorhabditis remanei TaxID=31234 RepID=E3MFK4_CAERE|nr:hypothetical protein CRE_20790 [Caenorhabditis remanei]